VRVPMLDLPRQQREMAAALEAAVHGVIAHARYLPDGRTTAFEEKLAGFCGRAHAIGVGSGSSALQISLLAAGIGSGDEVVTVPNSFFATTEAILLCGALPRFVDVEPHTHLMSLDHLPEAISERTVAILPVHLFGNVVDVPAIQALLRRLGREDVVVIEDCAHAIGAALRKLPVPLGPIGAFSFNPGKNIGALGDAGAIVTDDERIAAAARLLRDHGRAAKNEHAIAGFNSRLGSIDDAVLALKIDRLEAWNARRRTHAARYDARFAGTAVDPVKRRAEVTAAFHQYVIRVGRRDQVRRGLAARGVETAIHYPTLIVEQPPLRRQGWSARDVPVAAANNGTMLSIPCFPELEAQEIEYVADAVLAAVRESEEKGAA